MQIPDSLLPDDWDQNRFGDPICPHGHQIEQDGECPEGCVSPLREQGLI